MRPADLAMWYYDQKINNDKLAQWLFSQGEDVHWCASAFLAWCRESGNWFESAISDRGKLRRVSALVNYAKAKGFFCTTREDAFEAVASGKFAGVGYVLERDGDPYGHIGMYYNAISGNGFVGVEGNVSDSIKVMRRKITEVTGWLIIPKGGPDAN